MTAQIVTNSGGGPVVGTITLDGLDVNTPVTCTNLDDTGVLGWQWELIDVPAPSPTLNPIPPPTYLNVRVVVPDVAGHTILVRLTTYTDVARTIVDDVDQVAIRVKFLQTGNNPPLEWVIPAAQETSESDMARGWATEMNAVLRDIRALLNAATRLNEVVQTTDATPNPFATYTTTVDSRVIGMSFVVLAYDVANDLSARFVVEVTAKRDSFGVVSILDEYVTVVYRDNALWDVNVFAVTPYVHIEVTGDVGNTVEWRLVGEVHEHG